MGSGTIHEPVTIISEDELELAASSRIDSFCLINATGGAKIYDESVIHAGSHIVGTERFEMGPRSVITYNCVILTSTADLGYPTSSVVPDEQRQSISAPVTLKEESFVGSGAVVTPGTTLHEGAVVAANTYVNSDVPPWTVQLSTGETRPRPKDSLLFNNE